jgi:hypothetical protein
MAKRSSTEDAVRARPRAKRKAGRFARSCQRLRLAGPGRKTQIGIAIQDIALRQEPFLGECEAA